MDGKIIELCKMECWDRDGKTIYRIIINSTGLYSVCDDRGLFQGLDEMIRYLEKQKKELQERLK